MDPASHCYAGTSGERKRGTTKGTKYHKITESAVASLPFRESSCLSWFIHGVRVEFENGLSLGLVELTNPADAWTVG
jgi:hypothetical protein